MPIQHSNIPFLLPLFLLCLCSVLRRHLDAKYGHWAAGGIFSSSLSCWYSELSKLSNCHDKTWESSTMSWDFQGTQLKPRTHIRVCRLMSLFSPFRLGCVNTADATASTVQCSCVCHQLSTIRRSGTVQTKRINQAKIVLNTSSLLACGGKSILSYSFLPLNVPCLGEVRPSLTLWFKNQHTPFWTALTSPSAL